MQGLCEGGMDPIVIFESPVLVLLLICQPEFLPLIITGKDNLAFHIWICLWQINCDADAPPWPTFCEL